VDRRVLAAVRTAARERAPHETGGMLVGWTVATGDVVACASIGPGPRAVFKPDRFEPDGRWQQKELTKIYAASGRTVTYVGDWHSHPRGSGRPSPTDVETAELVAATPESRAPAPVTLVLACRRRRWRAHAYRFTDGVLERMTIEVCAPSAPGVEVSLCDE
jgi:integrative and conjugative element protein (TIGR02256 family)